MIVDAHAHLGGPEEMRARRHMLTLFSAGSAAEAAVLAGMQDAHSLACCGLHPWNAGKDSLDALLPYIKSFPVLGEIGLDSVWTDTPMALQRRAFREQLELAQELGKPVVLHTKGMEAEIARTIRFFSVPKLVHWYASTEHLESYLEQDCYFTVGPDHAVNPAVQQLLRRVPLNRLLTETDGMSAVSWALGREADPAQVEQVLRGELAAIAAAKDIDPAAAEDAVHANLLRFIGAC